ncbi:MAG TPA: hypothetical protein VLV28_05150 [Gaiellaceae bacterium]|nr:hypothetical protein [Gaiellaceae bacterium]
MRRVSIILGFVAVLGLAAVTGSFGLSKSVDPVAAAASKSESAGGANVALSVGIAAPNGQSYSLSATGVTDGSSGDVTADLSSLLAAAGVPATGGSVELRWLQESGDPVVYVNAPFVAAMLPGGQSWIRLDLEQAAKSFGVDLNQVLGQLSQNPASALDLLRTVGSVQTVGTETLNGESTTHYLATIDLVKAAGQIGSQAQSFAQHLIDQGAPSSLPVDVWIGDDGLVRQVVLDESATVGGQTGGVHLKLDLSGYGTSVSVSAPAASDTFDATGLVQAAASMPHSSAAFGG